MARHVQVDRSANKSPPPSGGAPQTMDSAVLLDLTTPREAAWRAALDRSGVHLGAASDRNKLVHCTIDDGRGQLVCLAPGVSGEIRSGGTGLLVRRAHWHCVGQRSIAQRMTELCEMRQSVVVTQASTHWQSVASRGQWEMQSTCARHGP